jgi:hypothetical protein
MKRIYLVLLLPLFFTACLKEDDYFEKCLVGEWLIDEAYIQSPKQTLDLQDQVLQILPDNRVTLKLEGTTLHGVWDTRTETTNIDENGSSTSIYFELYLLDGTGEFLIEAEGALGSKKMTLKETRDGECYVYKLKVQ